MMKKVLLFTAKFPSQQSDTDGGSVTVKQLIHSIKDHCILDGVFLRAETSEKIEGIQNISFINGDFLSYENYGKGSTDKFLIRLEHCKTMAEQLIPLLDHYDKIVIIHCLQSMGLSHLPLEVREKILLFPMFLSDSYRKSGDIVPEAYELEEKKALQSVGGILTPSYEEFRTITSSYGVSGEKIHVIPRAVDDIFHRERTKTLNHRCIQIIYVASFKNQKNNIAAIQLASGLLTNQVDFHLHLVGSVQGKDVYQQCLQQIETDKLTEYITIHPPMWQKELSSLFEQMDFNISVSHWETFGRGIFEGLFSGLPTVILNSITCVKDYIQENQGVIFVDTVDEIREKIQYLTEHPSEYAKVSAQTQIMRNHFTVGKQAQSIRDVLFQEG